MSLMTEGSALYFSKDWRTTVLYINSSVPPELSMLCPYLPTDFSDILARIKEGLGSAE